MFTKLKNNMSRSKRTTELQFSLDKADSEAIAGWVIDPKQSESTVIVEIRLGDTVLWSSPANNLRQDLLDAGISDGKHGFHCQFSDEISHSISGAVDVYAAGVKLNDVDILIEHNPIPVAEAQVDNTLQNLKYHFDKISIGFINGWVRLLDNDGHKVTVQCKVGDVLVGETVADNFREDLKNAGIGDGQCSFTLIPEFSSLPDDEARFSIYLDGCLVPDEHFAMVLSAEDVSQVKLNEQVAKFSASVRNEINTITSMIQKQNMNDGKPADSIAGVCHVLIEKVAEINTRISVIENAVLKHIEKPS